MQHVLFKSRTLKKKNVVSRPQICLICFFTFIHTYISEANMAKENRFYLDHPKKNEIYVKIYEDIYYTTTWTYVFVESCYCYSLLWSVC